MYLSGEIKVQLSNCQQWIPKKSIRKKTIIWRHSWYNSLIYNAQFMNLLSQKWCHCLVAFNWFLLPGLVSWFLYWKHDTCQVLAATMSCRKKFHSLIKQHVRNHSPLFAFNILTASFIWWPLVLVQREQTGKC